MSGRVLLEGEQLDDMRMLWYASIRDLLEQDLLLPRILNVACFVTDDQFDGSACATRGCFRV